MLSLDEFNMNMNEVNPYQQTNQHRLDDEFHENINGNLNYFTKIAILKENSPDNERQHHYDTTESPMEIAETIVGRYQKTPNIDFTIMQLNLKS